MSLGHEHFMDIALEEARIGIEEGNAPVGSVVVFNGEVVGRGRNRVASLCDTTAHAETVAIRKACANLKKTDLAGCTLYTTFEPCPMCCWATLNAGVGTLVLGARHVQIRRTDMGGYSVEKLMALTGRKIELVTGIRVEEGEAMRRQGTAPMPPTTEG
jgi:tRNA(adenine34) deaminase